MLKTYSIDEFREAVERDGDSAASEAVIRTQILDEIEAKADSEASRRLTFTISTASVDRDRDTVSLDGWDLANFVKNPVVLWAHNYRQLPIGRSGQPYRSGSKLKADVEFTPKGMNPFNDTVFDMYRLGFMRAVSVGFRPRKWVINEERRGYDFTEQELLEFSAVPVPANPDALMDAKSAGIDIEPLRKWAEGILGAVPSLDVADRVIAGIKTLLQPEKPKEIIPDEPWQLSLRRRQIQIESIR